MRKIRTVATIILSLAVAAVICLALAALPRRLVFARGERYTFYLGDTSRECRVVSCDGRDAALTRLTLNGVCGESTTFASLDVEEFLNEVGGEIAFTEELSDSVNYYCKAPLEYSVMLYGREINLHVCVKSDGVTVASPIIFGGY